MKMIDSCIIIRCDRENVSQIQHYKFVEKMLFFCYLRNTHQHYLFFFYIFDSILIFFCFDSFCADFDVF